MPTPHKRTHSPIGDSMSLEITPTAQQLDTPSKWDIIPLHTSDRATFKACRRRWYWSSPAQRNLVQKPSVYGIYKPFWFGTGIHYALQQFYNPLLKEDPEVAFDSWFDIQWNGGIIAESEIDEFKDRKPYKDAEGVWRVEGLCDMLPNADDEDWEEHHQLGLGMMRFYKEYAEREDDFTVVNTEHGFSVPILDPTGAPLYMVDTRPMPEDWETNYLPENEYGPLMRIQAGTHQLEKQVHARGRMDLIVQSNKTGNYVLIDHKTVGRAIDDNYFRHLDLDEQCTTYSWAAELEAKMYGQPYTEIAGIVYQAIRKAYPVPPTLLKNGTPSTNRAQESTTARLFEKTIKDCGLTTLFESDAKMQSYYTYLVDMGDKQFVWRESVIRNKAQKASSGMRIYLEALDMLDAPRIYPNPTKDYSCLNCHFRQPCVSLEAGYDWESMIDDNYESNYDR
jgi:hypothetical protein